MKRAGMLSLVLAAVVTGACGGAESVGTAPTGTSTTTTTTSSQPTPQPSGCTATAPTNLRVVETHSTVATLQWDPSPGALEYVVLVGTTPSSSDVLSTNTSNPTYTGTMKAGRMYARVQARYSCGWSGSSNEVEFTLG